MLLRGILLHTVRILKQISILICFHGQILKVREMVMLKKKKISWLYTHLEEISSLSHSVAFLYFFSLNAEKGFLISSCCSLEFCIQMGISLLFPFAFRFPSFHSYFWFSELFKKIRDTKGRFYAKMGSIKDINGMDMTETEDIKKWQEYTEELYKKDLHDPDNHNGLISFPGPNILECEVKWALGSITMNKVSGGDGFPVELCQILKDDAVKVLHSICQQIWKTQQWPQD